MSEIIVFKRGWKGELKRLWLKQKIFNMDFRGLGRTLKDVCRETGMDYSMVVQARIWRSVVDPFKNYAEYCVISEVGHAFVKEVYENDHDLEYIEPMDEVDLPEHYDDPGDIATTFTQLKRGLDKLIKEHPRVHFKIGGEHPTSLEKSDNWSYYVLQREVVDG